jgi:hypothetical protein
MILYGGREVVFLNKKTTQMLSFKNYKNSKGTLKQGLQSVTVEMKPKHNRPCNEEMIFY